MNKWMAGLIGFLAAFVSVNAFAASVIGTWNANTEPDLAGYKVYYGTAPGVYGAPIDVGNVVTHTVTNLAEKTTYYFALTAYDTSGNESGKSMEVSVTTGDFTAPGVPSGAVWAPLP